MRIYFWLPTIIFGLGVPATWTKRYNDFIGQFDGDGTDHGWWMKPKGPIQLKSHDPQSKQAAAWAKISHGQLAPAEDNDTDDRQLENLEDQLNGLLDDLKDSPDYEQLKERIQYLIDPN